MSINSSSTITWWLLSIVTTAALAMGGGWAMKTETEAQTIRNRVTTLEQNYAAINAKLDILLASRGLRKD